MSAALIRDEAPGDAGAIRAITLAAFDGKPYSQQTEAAIVNALRAAGAMSVSLVAVEHGEVVGHVAFSPVTIDGAAAPGWFGIGPVSVRPDRQRMGVGSRLLREGLERVRRAGARGCVLVGDPGYYSRFGFRAAAPLTYPGVPAQYFQVLEFEPGTPAGVVEFHPAFGASDD